MVWCEYWSTPRFNAEPTALHYSNGSSDTQCERGLPWEMLYADDLVLVEKCEELKEKLRKWNECLKDKGLKINEDKTKVMCESFGTGTTQVVGNVKHPCSVCLKELV